MRFPKCIVLCLLYAHDIFKIKWNFWTYLLFTLIKPWFEDIDPN